MLASTTPITKKQPVEVISEATQDFEVLVICSHTDQLVPAPLAALQLQQQQAMDEATGGRNLRLGSAGSPSRQLLGLGIDASASIRPKDIDGPNVCAPVTQFDEERFRHHIQHLLTVNKHYFETNRTPRGAQRDRLTSSNRKRYIAVLTDHMTQAQREKLAMEIRTRIEAAAVNAKRDSYAKRVLELSFFTKNPDANARGREYLRASVPNTADIQHVTNIQSDYIKKCANPYNYSKAEMQMAESEQERIEKHSDRFSAAMATVKPTGAFELRSNIGHPENPPLLSTFSSSSPSRSPRNRTSRSNSHKNNRNGSWASEMLNGALKQSSGANGGGGNTTASSGANSTGDGANRGGEGTSNTTATAVRSNSNRAGGGDDTSDSDDDFTVPAEIANNPDFIRAINGGLGGKHQQVQSNKQVQSNQVQSNNKAAALAAAQQQALFGSTRGGSEDGGGSSRPNRQQEQRQNYNLSTREGLFASLNLGGPSVVYPSGRIYNQPVSTYGYGQQGGAGSLGSTLNSTSGQGGGTISCNATTDLQQKLSKANSLHAKEVAKASIALVAEDVRRRGLLLSKSDAPPLANVPPPGTASSARAPTSPKPFLPTLVDPNAAIVMGEISAFTKGRFDKRSGTFTGAFSSGGQSAFANADASDHAASARRRSLFGARGAKGAGEQEGAKSPTAGKSSDPSVESGGGKNKNAPKKNGDASLSAASAAEAAGKGGKSAEDSAANATNNPRHAKFLISRTPFAGTGSTANSSHTNNILTNTYLFNALFEQINGLNSLTPHPLLTIGGGPGGSGPQTIMSAKYQNTEENTRSNTRGISSGASSGIVGVKQEACVLSNATLPVTNATKKLLLHRMLDAFGDTVVAATLRNADMLNALIEANNSEMNGLVATGGSAMSTNLNTVITDLSLTDYLLTLLSPEPITLQRASGGAKDAAAKNSSSPRRASLLAAATTTLAIANSADASSSPSSPRRSWLCPDQGPEAISSTDLRLSPRKAEAISDRIEAFAHAGPKGLKVSRVGQEVTTMTVTDTGAYKFRTSSAPRERGGVGGETHLSKKALAFQQLTPIQQHLKTVIKGGELAIASNQVLSEGAIINPFPEPPKKDSIVDAGAGGGKMIPRPPSIPIASGAATPQVKALDLPLAIGIDGRNTTPFRLHRSPSYRALNVVYSSSYHDALLQGIIAKPSTMNNSSNNGNGNAPRRRSITLSDDAGGNHRDGAGASSNNKGPNKQGQYDAAVVALVRPFDQFFRVFDPELTAHVRRDTFILALLAACAAHGDNSIKGVDIMGTATAAANQQQLTHSFHRRDAKSAIYFSSLWIICLLFQQSATTEDIKLGELFALRDCLRNVALREQRLAESDKAIKRLNQTIQLLTPRGGGGGGNNHSKKGDTMSQSGSGVALTSATTKAKTMASCSSGSQQQQDGAATSKKGGDSPRSMTTTTGGGDVDAELDSYHHSSGLKKVPATLLCLERAASHGIDTHTVVSYGELALALTAALMEDDN